MAQHAGGAGFIKKKNKTGNKPVITVLIREYTCELYGNQERSCGFLFLYYSFILQNEMKNKQIKSTDYRAIMVMKFTTKNYSSHNR
ncbi:hypothetical protein ACSR9E_03640 [Citrobacter koseri]|uniref:hypothetical protein n=1 Tax=Citrobacter koseri TaxID=545 RepID=UPI00389177F4